MIWDCSVFLLKFQQRFNEADFACFASKNADFTVKSAQANSNMVYIVIKGITYDSQIVL